MPNGNNLGGPNLSGPRRVIWAAILALFAVLGLVLLRETGWRPW